MMMQRLVHGVMGLIFLILVPSAFAQSGIAGVVRDTTGAVLPGVTVEAFSPVLIEKVRTGATDGQGLYKLLDLRPGTYSVTFTLPGFATVRQEGIELPASFTATVNASLRVGAVEETITISGSAPTVDVQGVTSRTVLSNELLGAIPGTRVAQSFVPYLPGVSGVALGAVGRDTRSLAIHGSRVGEANIAIAGSFTRHVGAAGGGADAYYVNPAIIEELSVELGGGSAEQQTSGIFTNIIPKEGSNSFSGLLYLSYTDEHLQADNLTDDLRASGLTAVGGLKKLSDVNPAFGGRILRDKLWFYSAVRYAENSQYIAGLYYNADPTAWVYRPDLGRPAFVKVLDKDVNTRLTWQATAKHKLSFYYGQQPHYVFQRNYSSTVSPEATTYTPYLPNLFTQLVWKAPLSNRFLTEASISRQFFDYSTQRQTDPLVSRDIWAATELSTGMRFRAAWPVGEGYGRHPIDTYTAKVSASYVTGSHAFKAGFDLVKGSSKYSGIETNGDVGVTLFNGVPRSLTLTAHPLDSQTNVDADLGVFAQDRWTIERLTFNLGVRYDYFNSSVPAQYLPAGRFVPARSYEAVSDVPNWKDVSPRAGMSYDLFGDGKTAVKVTLGRYAAGVGAYFAAAANPVNTAVTSATRTWNDNNMDFVPDCNLALATANFECGTLSDLNFGKQNSRASRYDDDLIHGSGRRGYNWETSVILQRELLNGVSANVGYYRRWYGNFTTTDNLAASPSDYDPYCITAPMDTRLPASGGNRICGMYDGSRAIFGLVNNLVTLEEPYGVRREVYDGVDLTVNARFGKGGQISGGLNSGHTAINTCFVVDSPQQLQYCDVAPPFQAQVKFLGSYPLPWWDLAISGVFQSVPGPEIRAEYVATNAEIRPSLGRDLSSGASGTALVNLIQPGTIYADRLSQLDFRLSKLFSVGAVRISANLDAFNLFNTHAVQSLNIRYGPSWLAPTQVQGARYIQFGGQISF